MRHKIKEAGIPEDKKMFLFFPRYCSGCLTRFWLESLPSEYTGGWWSLKNCPLCGGNLWIDKKTAQYYYNKRGIK